MGSIVPHDYPKRGTPPEAAQAVARDRRSRTAMGLSHRREGARTRHHRFRLRRHGLACVRARAHCVVGVLQSRAVARTHRRTRTDRRSDEHHVAAEARLDVATVALCLRDSDPVARVCRVGSRHESTIKQGAARDDGRNDPDRVLWLVVSQTKRYQRRSRSDLRLALACEFRRTSSRSNR